MMALVVAADAFDAPSPAAHAVASSISVAPVSNLLVRECTVSPP